MRNVKEFEWVLINHGLERFEVLNKTEFIIN